MFVSSNWDILFNGSSAEVSSLSEKLEAKFVANKNRERDSFGDYEEGGNTEIWVIFEVNGKYYKKFGYQSSYGGREWDGGVVEVTPTTKTITVWE